MTVYLVSNRTVTWCIFNYRLFSTIILQLSHFIVRFYDIMAF